MGDRIRSAGNGVPAPPLAFVPMDRKTIGLIAQVAGPVVAFDYPGMVDILREIDDNDVVIHLDLGGYETATLSVPLSEMDDTPYPGRMVRARGTVNGPGKKDVLFEILADPLPDLVCGVDYPARLVWIRNDPDRRFPVDIPFPFTPPPNDLGKTVNDSLAALMFSFEGHVHGFHHENGYPDECDTVDFDTAQVHFCAHFPWGDQSMYALITRFDECFGTVAWNGSLEIRGYRTEEGMEIRLVGHPPTIWTRELRRMIRDLPL